MKRHVATALGVIAVFGAMASSSGCVVKSELDKKTFNVRVGLTLGDGAPLPPEEQPLCLDLRGKNPDPACAAGKDFVIDLEALDTTGKRDTSFNHYVRVTVRPGTVVSVTGDRANGRNIRLEGGVATGQKVHLIGAYGPTRIEVEDIGYDPVDVGGDRTPGCANGKDDDGDGLVDYPADPGCSYPNDDSEGTGTSAAGVSPIIWYAYPDVAAAQGYGASTSFEQESVVFETRAERGANMIVTRVSSQGFYVTDLAPDPMTGKASTKPKDWGSLYVFNFGLPGGIRVCDRVTYLSGTMSEFFGYTELGFPSFGIRPWDPRAPELGGDGPCPVPEPFPITASLLSTGNIDGPLEKVEAGLVRIATSHVAQKLGPKFPEKVDMPDKNPCERVSKAQTGPNTSRYLFTPDATNCDFDGSGGTDFDKDVDEAVCVCFCYLDWECSQFDTYRSRGNFRVVLGSSAPQTMQVNTGTVPGFEPTEHRGETLPWITGSLANFSGGNLNWTVETRCADDLVTCPPGDTECASCLPATQSNPNPPCLSKLPPPVSVGSACVKPRTVSDNESGSNLTRMRTRTRRLAAATPSRALPMHTSKTLSSLGFLAAALLAAAPSLAQEEKKDDAKVAAPPADAAPAVPAAPAAPAQAPASPPVTAVDPRPSGTPAASDITRSSDAMDTRLTWTFGDDDVTKRTGETVPISPKASVGDRQQYRLFFDNLNSRFGGRENLTHFVLYRKMPGYIEDLDTEASLVLRVDMANLAARTNNVNSAFYDAGSYLRLFYKTGMSSEGKKTGFDLTFFPLDTDRFRLGYLYDISWGGTAQSINQSIFPRLSGSAPGAKFQYTGDGFYGFVGFKTAQIVERQVTLVGQQDIESTRIQETNFGFLGGGGVDFTQNVRLDAGAGYFQQGRFEQPDLPGKRVYTMGASSRLVIHDKMPVPASVDFSLYRNDPNSPMVIFRQETYSPGSFAWAVALEGTQLKQNLKDFDRPAATKLQSANAAALSGTVKAGFARVQITSIYRDLAFVVRNQPGYIPFEAMPSKAKLQPEMFFAAAFDYYLEKLHLTPGLGGGLQLPATFSSSQVDIFGADVGRTVVVRQQGNLSLLPEGKKRVPIIQARASLRWDISPIVAAILWGQLVHDNNATRLEVAEDGTRFLRKFVSPDLIGFGTSLQARF